MTEENFSDSFPSHPYRTMASWFIIPLFIASIYFFYLVHTKISILAISGLIISMDLCVGSVVVWAMAEPIQKLIEFKRFAALINMGFGLVGISCFLFGFACSSSGSEQTNIFSTILCIVGSILWVFTLWLKDKKPHYNIDKQIAIYKIENSGYQ